MGSHVRSMLRLSTIIIFAGALSGAAFAASSTDRTQFGHNISVGPGEEVSEVTCFGCSVRVRGHVSGDVTTFGGSVVVEDQGEIGGDTTTFAGDVRLDKGVKVGAISRCSEDVFTAIPPPQSAATSPISAGRAGCF